MNPKLTHLLYITQINVIIINSNIHNNPTTGPTIRGKVLFSSSDFALLAYALTFNLQSGLRQITNPDGM